MILFDADVLGRHRTGDETYVTNLLRELPRVAPDLRFAAVTRHPELVPEGVEPIPLPARSQELRMAWSLPRLLRRLRPELAHFQHALPLGFRGKAVVTLHDLSFERDPELMGRLDRLTFKLVVPRAARGAAHVLVVSERTKHDVVDLYGVASDKVTVTRNGVDPHFVPGGADRGYLLFVGAIQARKDPLAALAAARAVGRPLVAAGPEKDPELTRALREGGADLRGYVTKDELAELYRGASALLMPSRYEGFGLPVVEAMACGTPVVISGDEAMREVAGDAAEYADDGDLANGRVPIQQVLDFHHGNVLAAANDNVLGASGDADVTVGIHASEIAGVEPTIWSRLIEFRAPEVANEHADAAALQMSFYARRLDRSAVAADHAHLDTRQCDAVGAEDAVVGIAGDGRGYRSILAHAPCGNDTGAQPTSGALHEGCWGWGHPTIRKCAARTCRCAPPPANR